MTLDSATAAASGLRRRLLLAAVALVAAFACACPAHADLEDESALAARYSPVVRIVEQPESCGAGEPYVPIDVDVLFDDPTVALRGPWNKTDLVKIGPSARDLVGRYQYHLDFPGDALHPGCDYESWQRRLTEHGSPPTVYAHVATDPAHPGQLALQYWFFYVFNDFNNLHEGDWEMIQLDFDARDARDALGTTPVAAGYSSHEGAERAAWDDPKLELVGGTHPVVYPAAGSHANKYTAALYLGSSADAGVGCDDTRGPHEELRPVVKTIPSDAAAARAAFPWIAFDGRWGEFQPAFFNGPEGPNLKSQWTAPISWSETWRSRSYAVPTGGVLGTGATDFFCGAVATGSKGLVQLLRSPGPTLLALVVLVAAALFAGSRTSWRPSAPLRVARRRSWGQTLSAAAAMYAERPLTFLGIGLLFIPLGAAVAALEALVLGGFGLIGVDVTGESAGAIALLVVIIGTTLALLAFALVQAATACALLEIDARRPTGAVRAYRAAMPRLRPLVGGLALAVAVCAALVATGFLIPVAAWLAVRWALLAQAVELDRKSGFGGLGRSAQLVRGRWLRVASLVGLGAILALLAGPLLGALLILVTDAPLPLLNIVAGIVYALASPFVALTTSYVYFDARTRIELDTRPPSGELPPEIDLDAGAVRHPHRSG
jgi:hypothetical protein